MNIYNNTYIIAEVGSNFTRLDDCIDSIHHAKLCGADAVKFQLFDHKALYGFDHEECKKLGDIHPSWDSSVELNPDWIPKLKEACEDERIDFLCSAFSPALIRWVDPYVLMHKVASSETTHVRMLEVLKELGKPVMLSTGGKTHAEIESALHILGDTPCILMYCVSSYPASQDVNFDNIPLLRHHFGKPVGYSDHTLDVFQLPKLAAQHFGAVVIEKHFTLSKDFSTPDVGHSLDPIEFASMVKSIRQRTLQRRTDLPGESFPLYRPGESEQDMILKHNRRLIVTKPIKRGDLLKEGENFGIYRELKEQDGLGSDLSSPFKADSINGKISRCDHALGDRITPDYVFL